MHTCPRLSGVCASSGTVGSPVRACPLPWMPLSSVHSGLAVRRPLRQRGRFRLEPRGSSHTAQGARPCEEGVLQIQMSCVCPDLEEHRATAGSWVGVGARTCWSPCCPSGVEQTKQSKEEPKEEKVAKPESVLIKRRLSAQGQAISVVGSLSAMSTLEEEAPQAKRRPEPIIPVTQPR